MRWAGWDACEECGTVRAKVVPDEYGQLDDPGGPIYRPPFDADPFDCPVCYLADWIKAKGEEWGA